MKRYGYVRVSAKGQNPERQLLAMQKQRIKQENIYLDKMFGQDFSRPQYLKLLKKLKKGDVFVIKSIDRLGRNYGEILEQWRIITKNIGADIQVIDMPLLNTNYRHEDLTGVLILIWYCRYWRMLRKLRGICGILQDVGGWKDYS